MIAGGGRLRFPIYGVLCPRCKGTGEADGKTVNRRLNAGASSSVALKCSECKGTGVVRASVRNRSGISWERE